MMKANPHADFGIAFSSKRPDRSQRQSIPVILRKKVIFT